MSRLTILAVAALIACACGVTDPEESLENGRALWERNGPASYAMTINLSCECLPPVTTPVRVVVRDGVVASRTYVQTGEAVDPLYYSAFPTVDGLFDMFDVHVRAGDPDLEIRYHPILGYPLRMQLGDPHTDAPVITVSDFQPL
jgi:hypothetical protein